MAESRRNFSTARMNKDLDERLVPPGEYRDANNIEIATSEGSNVGTAQNIKGNTEKTTVASINGTNPTSQSFGLSHNVGNGAKCIATITDEKNNKIYSFISDGLWKVKDESSSSADFLRIHSDYILEYDVSNDTYKYVFNDIYQVDTEASAQTSNSTAITLVSNQGVRPGMVAQFTTTGSGAGDFKIPVSSLSGVTGVVLNEAFTGDLADGADVAFVAGLGENKGRVLNFKKDTKITGINILDDFLLWTDNETEPKKINIKRSIAGTGVPQPDENTAPTLEYSANNTLPGTTAGTELTTSCRGNCRHYHTRLYSQLDSYTNFECVTNEAKDFPIYVQEEHITVIKKAPVTPPTLEMSAVGLNRKNSVSGAENITSASTNVQMVSSGTTTLIVGDTKTFTFAENLDWRDGDIILCQKIVPADPNVLGSSTIKFKVDGTGSSGAVTTPNILQNVFDLTVVSIAELTPTSSETWYFAIQKPDPIFEFKFPRFAYRYKYTDGEYSPFSPWSQIAFIPAPYSYKPKEGYNLGMVNQLRGLKIKDYLVDLENRPEDVVEVDILYKEESSPSVYTVKTLNRQDGKAEGLELVWPDATLYTRPKRGEFEIKSELIHAVVPENQTLRPWDNVPKKALAQEIVGNRVVYGNYVQNYDTTLGDEKIKPEFEVGFENSAIEEIVSDGYQGFITLSSTPFLNGLNIPFTIPPGDAVLGEPQKSIKSLRNYQVGVVYCDKNGRETPVLTDKASGSIYLGKEFSDHKNQLYVTMKTLPPDWATHYKFYIKETSNEYYNLALDRWYDAEDGNVWLSFPSSERNKVDIDTFLVLKKPSGTNVALKDKARYKILAIESEAPEWIKTNSQLLGDITSSGAKSSVTFQYTDGDESSSDYPTQAGDGYPAKDQTTINIDAENIETAFSKDNDSGRSVLVEYVKENKLFVKFLSVDGSQSSDSYRIVKMSKDEHTNDPVGHYYNIKIDGKFAEDIEFTGTSADPTSHKIRFRKEEVENSAEFDGRFFVKVLRDKALEDNVLEESDDFVVRMSRPIFFSSGNLNFNNQYDDEDTSEEGTEPDGYCYYNSTASDDDVSDDSLNDTGLGSYAATPGVYGQSYTRFNVDDDDGDRTNEARNENYFKNTARGKWAIDNEMAAYKGAGRGIHKDNQGSIDANKYSVGSNAQKMPLYGWNRINDCVRIESAGSDDTNLDRAGDGNRATSSANSKVTSNILQYPTDIYCEPDHNVMHLSRFGISGGKDILGNMEMDHEWDFAEAITTVGTRFKWQDDPNGTHYEIIRVETQPGIRNFTGDKQDDRYDNSANKRVRYTIKFQKVGTDGEGFGMGGSRFHPLVHAVDADGTAFATVSSIDVMTNAAGNVVEPYNYAGLPPNCSDSLTLQILDHYIPDDSDEKKQSPNPAIFETEPKEDVGLDIYYEASPSYPIEINTSTNEMLVPVGSTFTHNGTKYTVTDWRPNLTHDTTVYIEGSGDTPDALAAADGDILYVDTTYGGKVQLVVDGVHSSTSSIVVHGGAGAIFPPHQQKTHLPWFNCIAFGNGVESDRIRDDFNAPTMQNGVKASTTLAEAYKEERRKNGLIYSGIYNSSSGVNDLNQFIAAEKITKDLNPDYGSIQKLYQRNTDLLTLCEDRVLKVIANKDALYNADGNPQLIATNRVLGTGVPIPGEFGISTQPESFTSYANNCYFTDVQRGSVMRIQGDSMTPISQVGMLDYFADTLKDATLWKCLGTYDEKKLDYNLTIEKRGDTSSALDQYGAATFTTVTWSDRSQGWTSFKSFEPEQGASINNEYYTWKNGSMWKHHSNSTYNNFHGSQSTSDITVLFNDSPSSVKSFANLKYEGSQARVVENDDSNDPDYYNIDAATGWYCESISTNKQDGQVFEFKEKEGKWFNNIYGVATTLANLDTSEISVQGLGTASSEGYSGTPSYTLSITETGDAFANVSSISTISTGIVQGASIPDQTITFTHATGYPLLYTDISPANTGVASSTNDTGSQREFPGDGSTGIWGSLTKITMRQSGNNVEAIFDFSSVMGSSDLSIAVDWD